MRERGREKQREGGIEKRGNVQSTKEREREGEKMGERKGEDGSDTEIQRATERQRTASRAEVMTTRAHLYVSKKNQKKLGGEKEIRRSRRVRRARV
eukprot:6189911-Pleurochrysis_carterae.AAC.4